MTYDRPLTPDEQDAFLTAFLDEVIEPRNLAYGGGLDCGFVSRYGRGSATQEDRDAVSQWLQDRAEVSSATVGPMQDCWHEC